MKTIILLFMFFTTFIFAEDLYMPINIQKGYINKTRSESGKPGLNYWQNQANYKINIDFDPYTSVLKGNEVIGYYNNSPDTLDHLIFHLFPNLYQKGSPRDSKIDENDIYNGMQIKSIYINKKKIDIKGKMSAIIFSTLMKLKLMDPMKPGTKITISINWEYKENKNSPIRSGMVDKSSFFIAYFFPRIAVYDDINGWNQSEYTSLTEFYNDFGDFDVNISVPEKFIVWATGLLQNPEEVLTKKYLDRYKFAINSTKIVEIIGKNDILKKKHITRAKKKNIWKFKAVNITDFAFGTSDHYCWNGKSVVVNKKTGKKTFVETSYPYKSEYFKPVLKIACESIDFMSNEFPGVPFPFPKESIFQGYSDMEYPMMVNDAPIKDFYLTTKLTFHEIFHSYFPFYTGLNETKYAWMDEGLTSFADNLYLDQKKMEKYKFFYFHELYQKEIGYHSDIPIFAPSDILKAPSYYHNSYSKAAVFFITLEDYLGKSVFNRCIKRFIKIWNGKHPTPYDFFNVFKKESADNLNWLIKPWIFDYGYVDLGIKKVSLLKNKLEVVITKKGHYPVPIYLNIEYKDGTQTIIKRNVSEWKSGKNHYKLQASVSGKIKSLFLGDKRFNDADLSDNTYKFD